MLTANFVVTKKIKPKTKKSLKPKDKKPLKKTKKLPKKLPKKEKQPKRYYEAVGRRKTAVARVRLFTCRPFEDDKGKILVNGKPYFEFFPTLELRQITDAALRKMKSLNRFEATVKVKGGGLRGQAEAIRHGLARALVKFNPDFRKKLKRAGYLRRDPRMKERKKPGLKKARRAPQWQKR
jgi:small subunit ribosomal protein S9